MAQASTANTVKTTDMITIPKAEYSRLVLESEALQMLKRVLSAFEDRVSESSPQWAAQPRSPPHTTAESNERADSSTAGIATSAVTSSGLRPAIYIPSIPAGTALHELVARIKGGAIISIHTVNMKREGRNTTRGYLQMKSGAKEFLEWSKINPVFIHGKRVSFIWSNDKPTQKPAIEQAVAAGATRNIVIHGLGEKKVTIAMLREDIGNMLWHGSNIVSSTIKDGDAYLSTNSVFSAMRLRDALLTHHNYSDCTASYYPDPCDRAVTSKPDVLPLDKHAQIEPLDTEAHDKAPTESTWAPLEVVASSSTSEHYSRSTSSSNDSDHETFTGRRSCA